ncbi:MAG TPA: GNAT family N-acetyltransferase [Planctomycetota bacterium]|nr:GNAT family N-acetyltransferase [Planctomycetota bacterium]
MDTNGGLVYAIAASEPEFEAIHRLNYQTFVEEIPQHAANPERRLVDRFHAENTYAICRDGDRVVGMVAGRARRPFSLDGKLANLDSFLPKGHRPVEIRLLSVAKGYRMGAVMPRLVGLISDHFRRQGCDLGVISGTLRQARLYRHLGFEPFGPVVGAGDARFQPMFITLERFVENGRSLAAPAAAIGSARAMFLPGPVRIREDVRHALAEEPVSHRSGAFAADLRAVARALGALTGAPAMELLVGSGTLANDAVGGQISLLDAPGLVLANGEFGERLLDHAARWRLRFETVRAAWGEPLPMDEVRAKAEALRGARWIWAVHHETSTGVLNDLRGLADLARERDLALCVDAISSIGATPVDLRGVAFASCVSGKALGSIPGLAMVLHHAPLAPAPGRLPRYLDLGLFARAGGVPFTVPSNLLRGLLAAVARPDWPGRLERVAAASARLRAGMRDAGLRLVAADAHAAPGVVTVELPAGRETGPVLDALEAKGLVLHGRSGYLAERRWIQVCLMGEWDDEALDRVPPLLAEAAR